MDTLQGKPHWDSLVTVSTRPTFFLLCEDAETSSRAERLCRLLSSRVASQGITKNRWFTSQLRSSRLRQVAALEAARADVLILSLHHFPGLPPEIESWTGIWSSLRTPNDSSLVALLDPVLTGDSSLLQAQLEALAEKSGRHFVVLANDVPMEGPGG